MTPAVVALVPVFRSVDKPHLELDPAEDVWPCETCDYHYHPGCRECHGYGLVHGYAFAGLGRPVELVGWREAAASGSGSRPANNDTGRAPLPQPLPAA